MVRVLNSFGRALVASRQFQRQASVVAWGRNTSGEVGQGLGVVYEEPAILSQLEGAHVTSLAAGRHHSAAVVQTPDGGQAFSWGCGLSGKLGHGDDHNQLRPSRIEALVGQADIKQVALGHEHTLLLDAEGAVFSCGDNWQGQCGHGTPLQTIADQQRAAWEAGREQVHSSPRSYSAAATPSGSSLMQSWSTPQQEQRMAWARTVQPHSVQAECGAEVEAAQRLWAKEGNPGRSFDSNASLEPSPFRHSGTPTRIGRSLDNLVADQPSTSGIEHETVSCVAASKFFSAVSTLSGRVFTFGGGFSGELGNDKSWETSASQVGGAVLEALEQDGGVRKVCAGGTFCLALTHAGSVISWGGVPGSPSTRRRGSSSAAVTRIQGVPPMTDIAAGYSHAVLSDGQRIWTMGRWLAPDGSSSEGGEWGRPELFLSLEGVSCLAAGPHSSAAVSADGQLYLWGKLLSEDDVKVLRLKHGARDFPSGRRGAALWEGLGSSQPAPVSGLGRVRSVSLGFQHALAVVD